MEKYDKAVENLAKGDHKMKVFGQSMKPLIASGSEVTLRDTDDYEVGDAVCCKVKGRWMVHKVIKIGADGRYLIGNNRGYENGWTKRIFGRVVEVNGKPFGRPV